MGEKADGSVDGLLGPVPDLLRVRGDGEGGSSTAKGGGVGDCSRSDVWSGESDPWVGAWAVGGEEPEALCVELRL